MTALKNMPISFPGLLGDWEWNPDPIAIHVGHGVYWYGVILAVAMLCGMWFAMKQAKRYGLTEDHISDLVLWAVPCCIIGSRTYYVIFNLDSYKNADGALNWLRIIAVWDGGIAIYGTVLAGFLVALAFSAARKIPFGALTDTAVLGLLLGQAIGRWANLINREAYGVATTLPWRMRLWYNHARYMEVHPTFLYESLWNLLGILLILTVISKGRRFDGENTCFYFMWYGLGRLWIEGLRTDSLYLFNWTFLGQPIRVSQALSLFAVLLGGAVLYVQIHVKRRTPDGLYVNRLAAEAAAAEERELEEAVSAHGEAETAPQENGSGESSEPTDRAAAEGSPAERPDCGENAEKPAETADDGEE